MCRVTMSDMSRANPKLLDVSAAILAACPGRTLGITALNKALFYLDLLALRDFGRTMTGATYVALENGPVVEDYKTSLVEALEDAGLAVQLDDVGTGKPLALRGTVPGLSEAEARLVEEVARAVSRRTAGYLSAFSHDNTGWSIAHETGRTRGLQADPIDMLVALQQLGGDPWLDEPLTPDEERAFEAAECGAHEPW